MHPNTADTPVRVTAVHAALGVASAAAAAFLAAGRLYVCTMPYGAHGACWPTNTYILCMEQVRKAYLYLVLLLNTLHCASHAGGHFKSDRESTTVMIVLIDCSINTSSRVCGHS